MLFFKPTNKIVTHDGSFHADDVFACAVVTLYLNKKNQKFSIIRTRNPKIIEQADYVFDVGGVYDPTINRFDHHQKDTAGKRPNGVLYASFGLAWKHFGKELCNGNENIWKMLDERLVSSVDAIDNGMDISKSIYPDVGLFSGTENFLVYSPTWKEDEKNIDKIFQEQVSKATQFLERKIKVMLDDEEARSIMNTAYENSSDKRLVVLEHSFPRYILQDTLSRLPEVLYVVYPGITHRAWKVEAVTKSPDTLVSRKLLPESWRGLFDQDDLIRKTTGVKDALFCHKAGFLITAVSKEGALELASKALLA